MVRPGPTQEGRPLAKPAPVEWYRYPGHHLGGTAGQKESTPSTMNPSNCPPLRMSSAGKSL